MTTYIPFQPQPNSFPPFQFCIIGSILHFPFVCNSVLCEGGNLEAKLTRAFHADSETIEQIGTLFDPFFHVVLGFNFNFVSLDDFVKPLLPLQSDGLGHVSELIRLNCFTNAKPRLGDKF